MGLLSGSMVFLSVIGRYFYSKYGLKYKHKNKMWSVIIMWTISIFIMFLAKLISSFVLVLISCLLIGLGTSIGSLVVIGFIKCFPASVFSGFSIGTGVSGLLGAILYLLLKLFNFSFDSILLVMLLFYPFFGLAFYGIVKIKVLITSQDNEKSILTQTDDYSITNISRSEGELSNVSEDEITENVEEQEAKINEELSLHNVTYIGQFISSFLLAFYLLYIFEYISITEIGEQISLKYKKSMSSDDYLLSKTRNYFFEILQFMYQFGLLLGRSSLDLVKIQKVYLIITLLGLSAGSLFLQIYSNYLLNSFFVNCNFFFVGLFGGLGYANITYWVLEEKKLAKKYKVKNNH
jgi:MFS family permease